MKIEDYQALAMRTSPEDHDRLLNGCLGLIGESGEIVDVVKKWKFQSGENAELPKDKLIDECGDVLWYCAELCEGLKSSLAMNIIRYDNRIIQTPIGTHSIIRAACGLATFCCCMFNGLVAGSRNYSNADNEIDFTRVFGVPQEVCFTTIGFVVDYVRYILVHFCNSSLEEAMERNIEKLKKRYPDGFDPERSLHRPEYEKVKES